MKFIVTGASGYVGSQVIKKLRNKGHSAVSMNRTIKDENDTSIKRFYLGGNIDESIFKDADVLIHCAFDFKEKSTNKSLNCNVVGSENLFKIANKYKVKIVYISTISAFEGCKSHYGQIKFEIEKLVMLYDGVTIRPGLVYGANSGGMVGSLNVATKKLKYLIPLIGNGNFKLYLAHVDDLCDFIHEISLFNNFVKSYLYSAANSNPIEFKELLRVLAKNNENNPFFISVPWFICLFGLRLLETLFTKMDFRSDSIISLVFANKEVDFSLANTLIKFREFSPDLLK